MIRPTTPRPWAARATGRGALVLLVGAMLASALAPRPSAAAGTAGARPASENLLQNPGFETGGLLAPAGWDTTLAGLPTVLFYWDPEVHHSGSRSAAIVNAGDIMPIWHNWNQLLLHAGRLQGRDLELSVWVKSAQMGGRGYVMLQCYRDTVTLYAKDQGLTRDRARYLMGFHLADDPQIELGWARKYFSTDLDDWTEMKVRCYVPPSTDLVAVRFGIYGSGQVWFDDAQLTAEPARPVPPYPLGRNLLANPSFEEPINDWEFSMPPTPGARIEADSTTAHSGHYSVLLTMTEKPVVQGFVNACQVFNTRALSGKRVRLSGWVKLEDLSHSSAYLSVFSTGLYGSQGHPVPDAVSGTCDWTVQSMDFDVPKNSYTVWARVGYTADVGKVWWDDVKFEVLGDTPGAVVPAARRRARKG